jgi:hypothetical protein
MLKLKASEEQVLMGRVRTLLRDLADAWDPGEGTEAAKEQRVAKATMKEAAALHHELDRFE